MKIRYATMVTLLVVVTAIIATAIKWAPVDNEYFASVSPGIPYYTPIIPYKLRYIIVALVVAIFIAKADSFRFLIKPLVAILIIAFISTIWSVQPRETFVSSIELLLYVSVPAVAVNIIGPSKLIRIIWWVGVAILIVSAMLALSGSKYALMAGAHEGAWRGLFNHKNVFGPFASALILLTIFGRKIIDAPLAIRWAVIVVGVACLIMSTSTTALAACLIAFLFGLLISVPIRDRTVRIAAFAGLALFLVPAGLLAVHFADAAAGIFGKDLTFSGRTEIWKGAIQAASIRPLGYGFETSGGDLVLELIKQSSGYSKVASMHSAYIKAWIDLGLIGFVLVVGWLLWVVFTSFTTTITKWAPLMAAVALNHITMGAMEVAGGVSPSYSLFLLISTATAVSFYTYRDRSLAAKVDGRNESQRLQPR